MAEPTDNAAAPTGLPPAPWEAARTGDVIHYIYGPNGEDIVVPGGHCNLRIPPEVLRAILKLPELLKVVEAARKAIDKGWMNDLRDALALVDCPRGGAGEHKRETPTT